MYYSFLTNRRTWFVVGFALLLVLSTLYLLAETTLGATLGIDVYLPLTFNRSLCGTLPCQ